MKKIKSMIISMLLVISSFTFLSNVSAIQKYTMTIDGPESAIKGTNITLTFSAKNVSTITNGFAGYEGTINYDSSKLEFVSVTSSITGWPIYSSKKENKIRFIGYDDSAVGTNKDVNIFKAVFKVLNSAAGDTTITVGDIKGSTGSGENILADNVSKTFSIKESQVSKSSDSSLSSLGVTGYTLSPSFNPSNTSYKITVPNTVTKVSVSARQNDPKATISISGNEGLSVGKNNIFVEVRAEDGSKKIYTIEVTREAKKTNVIRPTDTKTKSNNNLLKSISGIDGLNFDPNKTEYNVSLPFDVSNLNIGATAQDKNAKIVISPATISNLKVGVNTAVTITVTAEDSSVRVYTINLKRSQYKSETDLKELIVNNKNLMKEKSDDDSYEITIPGDVKKLDISVIPKSKDSTVKIKGNKNLKVGNNTVIVEVTDKNGFTKSYTIKVEKKPTSAFLYFINSYWFIIFLLPLLLILFLIYLYRKNKKLIEKLDQEEAEYINTKPLNYDSNTIGYIDNKDDILYNSSSNIVNTTYVPTYDRSSDDLNDLNKIFSDDSVSEVEKEVKIVKNEMHGSENYEKEYKISEKYRKK